MKSKPRILCLVFATLVLSSNHEQTQATILQADETWQLVTTTHRPQARYSHGMVYDTLRHVMVLFGGDSSGSSRLNDTWEYDGVDWHLINTPQKPSGRINLSTGLVYDSRRGRVVVFGGLTATGYVSDTWEYDGANWIRINTPASPTPRDAYAAAYDTRRNVVVLFGGHRAFGAAMNDTWEYNGVTWQQRTPPTTPAGRWYAPMVYDGRRGVMILFGGRATDSSILNDTWEYDGTDWQQVITSQPPSPRSNHTMAYNCQRGEATLFGGLGGGNSLLTDTWRFNGMSWQQVSTAQAPPGRLDTAMVYDAQRQKFGFFGGGYWFPGQPQPTLFNDTWELAATGGLPPLTDLDGDALPDLWESSGYDADCDGLNDVDLPAMGASPTHKDIFVEVDYMEERICLGTVCTTLHTHRPNPDAIALVVQAFKDAPVGNIDGVSGINLHMDFGPDAPMKPGAKWGALSQSNTLSHMDNLSWNQFYSFKQSNLALARRPIFHYAIFAHFLEGNTCTSGQSPAPGVDFIVSLGGWGALLASPDECRQAAHFTNGTPFQQAGTFMHELGHNLGLHHGGNDDVHGKPNYLSVMNYAFQMRGLIYNNANSATVDYSRTNLTPPLNEDHLNELVGLNGGSATAAYGTRWTCPNGDWGITLVANGPIDWDCDGNSNEADIAANINQKPGLYESPPGEILGTFFDWASLSFGGGGQIGPANELSTQIPIVVTSIVTDELTLEMDSLIPDPYKVAVYGPGGEGGMFGHTTNYTVTVANLGLNADVYTITVTSSLGWANLSTLPTSISLAPGQAYDISIPVTIPPNADATDVDVLRVVSTSGANSSMWASHFINTTLLNAVYLPIVRK